MMFRNLETILNKIGNFEKYPAYKDSGVEWLGVIPAGWNAQYGFTFLFESKEKNNGMKRNTVLSLSYGNIRVKADTELTGLVPESFETYQLVNKGDIIFRPTDLQNDHTSLRSGISDFDGIITSAYLNLRIMPVANTKFVSYIFRCIDNNKVIYGLGSGLRQNIDYRDFRRFSFPFPPLLEQTAIAAFLDEKTVKIDTAIAQKEQMISLLKERKQILIQNAVTKGINPDAKMKDSDVEWIGEIPEGWEVEPIKYSLNGIIDCEHKTAPFVDEKIFFVVRTSNVKEGKLTFDDAKYTHEKGFVEWTKRGIPAQGDILLTREAPAGEACIVPQDISLCLGQRMVWLKVNSKRMLSQLIIHLIYSKLGRTYIDFLSAGSTVLHFNMSDIKNIPIVIMPFEEQTAIVDFITTQSAKIDTAISIQQQQIAKLKEYKSILIDSAVTGKIKVC
jgi:type I restriction enzyme S subunit